jgi:hypothetical protein
VSTKNQQRKVLRDEEDRLDDYLHRRKLAQLRVEGFGIGITITDADDFDWPDYLHRLSLENVLVHRGRFTREEACGLLQGYWFAFNRDKIHGSPGEVQRRAAVWLNSELKKLQEWENTPGASPIRRRGALSRLEIADLAIAMLDHDRSRSVPESELINLLAELLNVKRHRAAVASRPEFSAQFALAAKIEGEAGLQGKTIGVRKLAKLVSVSAGTITAWRKSPQYKDCVQIVKQEPLSS